MLGKNPEYYLRKIKNYFQSKYAENGAAFCPIVMSAFGGIHCLSYELGIKFLIHKIKKSKYLPPNWAAPNRSTFWLQRIAIALWAGNARKIVPFLKRESLVQLLSTN